MGMKCICDISAFGKVLRADCPECCARVSRGMNDPIRLEEEVVAGRLEVSSVNVPDAYPAERMHSEDGGVLEELTEDGPSTAKNQKGELVKTMNGIMNYITAGSPWDEEGAFTGDLKNWLGAVVAVGLECPTEQPVPDEVVKSYKTRLGTLDIIKGPGVDEETKPGMVVGRVEPIKTWTVSWAVFAKADLQRRKAVTLLRTWLYWDPAGAESHPGKETIEFLKETKDAEK